MWPCGQLTTLLRLKSADGIAHGSDPRYPLLNDVDEFWRLFLVRSGSTTKTEPDDVFAFGDTPAMADELAALVVAGRKTATSSLLDADERIAEIGDLSIVLDGDGRPRCIIETMEVQVLAYEDVNEEMARDEGEGDLSLESWRREHWAFFSRELSGTGQRPSVHMRVVFERFRVVDSKR